MKTGPEANMEQKMRILVLTAQGVPQNAIASDLTISPKTVGYHMRWLKDHFGFNDIAGATRYCCEHHLI